MKKISLALFAALPAAFASGFNAHAATAPILLAEASRVAGTAPTPIPTAGVAPSHAFLPAAPPEILPALAAAPPFAASVQAADLPQDVPQTSLLTQAHDEIASAAQAAAEQDQQARSAQAFDGSAAGKTLLLVGTSRSRPFIIEEAARTARQLGLRLLVLDKPEERGNSQALVPDAHFIPAPIDRHDETAVAETIAKVSELHKTVKIDAVVSMLNAYAELAGKIVDATGAAGNPGAAVTAAHTKSLARERLASVPEISAPYRVVKSADEARRAYRELGGGKFVMKPIQGGGSMFVVLDVDSEEKAAKTYREIQGGIESFKNRKDAGLFNLDLNPGILLERQFREGPEVDVELILQRGRVQFWHVSDNAPMDKPYAIEKNSTYPSQLHESTQLRLVQAAAKALDALDLKVGNMHVELMMTPDGPRILEVNARMGGAFVWPYIKAVTGISLVEQGIRAVLGLKVDPGHKPTFTLEGRFFIPKVTGRLEAVEGLEEAAGLPGVGEITMLKQPGDEVQAAPDHMFDYIGYLSATGKDYQEAMTRTMAALKAIKFRVRTTEGPVVVHSADYTHAPVDVNGMLEAGS